MSKEWQEASNEYAKVFIPLLATDPSPSRLRLPASSKILNLAFLDRMLIHITRSPRKSTLFTASARRATRAPALSRALPSRSHKWRNHPTGGESDADIGAKQDEDPFAHQQLRSVDCFTMGFESFAASQVSLMDDGLPLGAPSAPFTFLSFLSSIRQFMYLVLCYNQCISVVAIEKYLGPFSVCLVSTCVVCGWH